MGSDDEGGSFDVETALTRLGRKPSAYSGFVNMPLFRGSTVLFPDAETLESREVEYTYGRPSTPTTRALETALATLEGGAKTFLTPSGLSAISTTLLAFAEAGGHMLIADSVYYPTRRFALRVLKRMGVEVEYYDPLTGAGIAGLLRPETKLVLTELPGSQTFEVQDIPAICKAARAKGVPVAIDNTWGTPLYFPAFEHGVNISIQSCTKYIVGHADALLGAIICDEASAAAVGSTHEAYGLTANGEDCFLALRGLRTLAVRLARHWQSGLEIAAWLASRPEVAQVLHPRLARSPRPRALEARLQGRAAGLFSIVLKPCPKQAVQNMLNALQIFGMGYSWAGSKASSCRSTQARHAPPRFGRPKAPRCACTSAWRTSGT